MINCLRALWLLYFIAFSCIVSAQKINSGHIDGEIYLKYDDEFFINPELIENQSVLPVLPGMGPEITTQYGIYKIEAPFSASKNIKLKHTLRVYFSNHKQIDELINLLAQKSFIDYAEPVPYHTTGYTPNDLGASTSGQWNLWKISAQKAWDISKGDSNIKVAIVDDELAVYHPDLAANVWRNPGEIAGNKIDDDNNGYVDDVYGYDVGDKDGNPTHPNTAFLHGTHVGGIAGAVTDNGRGIASIGFNISLIGVKCTNNGQSNVQSIPYGFEGISYAVAAGADIINCSWSSATFSQTGQNVVDDATSKGCIVVAAASNDGLEQDRYPAAYNGVIAVASTDMDDTKSGFSNYGAYVDVCAPGASIYSTVPANNGYTWENGTSMSTPLVVGLFALMKSHNPGLTRTQLEQCLLNTADDIYPVNQTIYAGKLGKGRINAEKAMKCVDALALAKPKTKIQSSSAVACPNTVVQFFGTSAAGRADTYKWYFPGGNPSASTVANPVITYAAIGKYDVSLVISNSAGSDSVTLKNYIDISANGREILYTEDFENGTLAGMGFTVENPDSATTWELVNITGVTGNKKALRMNFYNYKDTGRRDALISPVIDLRNNAGARLNLQHAYRAQSTKKDSLLVYISLDSGKTFPYRVASFAENGQYSFATQSNLATAFTPTVPSDWCFETIAGMGCLDIDLADFDGNTVVLKLETYNAFGNNLYIDNLKVTAFCSQYNTQKPFAYFTNNDTSLCVPGTVKFSDSSFNFPTTRQWIFEGGNPATSTQRNPQVLYSVPGTYDVKLVVKNQFGADSIILTDYVTVNPLPVININATKTEICSGESVLMVATGADDYVWSPVFAINTTLGDSVVVSPPITNTYTVKGTTAGCTSAKPVTIKVNAGPGNFTISKNGTGLIANNSRTGNTYQWLYEGNTLPGETNKTIQPTQPGTYTVQATDSSKLCQTTATYYYNPLAVNGAGSENVKVYPNPASGAIYIDNYTGDAKLSVALYNMLGEQVLTSEHYGNNGKINISGLMPGIYFITLHNTITNITQKVIVNNE